MYKGNTYFYYFFIFLLGCQSHEKETIPETKSEPSEHSVHATAIRNINKYWPEGTFVQYFKDNQFVYIERWINASERTWLMQGLYVQLHPLPDTIFRIYSTLIADENKDIKMIYRTSVENKEIIFILSKQEENTFIFENPFRTFPSIMKYTITSDSTFEVLERGFKDGGEKEITYRVSKLK